MAHKSPCDDDCFIGLANSNKEEMMTADSSSSSIPVSPISETIVHLPVTAVETTSELQRLAENEEEEESLRKNLIGHVSNYSEIFSRNQQRDEPEISIIEKKKIATKLLNSSPSNFLAKFGKVLEPSHLLYFRKFKNTYEVTFYLQKLEERNQVSEASLKNRRFHAMNEMIKQGEYFSMGEMRKRNPILFHQLIEKYMSPEEKKMLEQDQPKICNLSTIFMAHIDGDETCSKRKNEQQVDQSAWDQASSSEEEEYDEDEDDVNQEEKQFFRDEFISSMHRSFLEGRDHEFDYSQIDSLSNPTDDIIYERDAEERYFDTD